MVEMQGILVTDWLHWVRQDLILRFTLLCWESWCVVWLFMWKWEMERCYNVLYTYVTSNRSSSTSMPIFRKRLQRFARFNGETCHISDLWARLRSFQTNSSTSSSPFTDSGTYVNWWPLEFRECVRNLCHKLWPLEFRECCGHWQDYFHCCPSSPFPFNLW